MCGRYVASRAQEDLAALFSVQHTGEGEPLPPDWNVAPTKEVYAVLDRPLRGTEAREPVRQLRTLRWGLVPSWSKSPDVGVKMINARAETLHEKPSYRRAFAARRCLLPADGYYEWSTGGEERREEEKGKRKRPRKQPYYVTPPDGGVLALAGLYEFWRDPSLPDDHPSAWWVTCVVVTTEAETTPLPGVTAERSTPDHPRTLSDIHPRMPLALPADRWDAWLDPATTDTDELRALLEPPPAGHVRAYPVSTEVSNARNNGPELISELTEPEVGTLF
ncbi:MULTISPECIES: SOS response-associated peptidase [unclassified Streptomyces]|uniref:SOS response-associated peptidase n=1 Tax=unclassified Streptomyces TaxID=2593676 RepID=UPI000CD49D2C|nr:MULTISPECIES: SOS response-associated peptidase [unclassified Streptomyces]